MVFFDLGKVPWSKLEHALGGASEMPEILQALTSANPKERDRAMEYLWSTIIHQGTVYSVSAYTVPFLIELLEAPGKTNPVEILELLTALSEGNSFHTSHKDLFKQLPTAGFEVGSQEWDTKVEKELGWVRATHLAVIEGTPAYLWLLEPGTSAKNTYCRSAHAGNLYRACRRYYPDTPARSPE